MQNHYKIVGILLVTGSVALLIPYTVLTMTFDYPDILRQDPAMILTKFHEGGNSLIWTWFAFAVTGLPLIPAYILIGRKMDSHSPLAVIATNLGVTGLILQMIGLLRWTFVVPVLSETFINAADQATRVSTIVTFRAIHQFAGVMLGEHLGQLLTIIWTILITISFQKSGSVSKWTSRLGYFSATIYLLAQAELFQTVMPALPGWDMAGFIGSTLWLFWLIVVGVQLIRYKNEVPTLPDIPSNPA
jgi:hypothetical protein